MKIAKEAVKLWLKSLPNNCYFNIFSFGSTYESIFPTCKEYNQKTFDEAMARIEKFTNNLNGTEIL